MMGIGLIEIFLILIYLLMGFLGVVLLGISIALGIRWGGRWLLKIIYTDPEFEKWLKQVLNVSDTSES